MTTLPYYIGVDHREPDAVKVCDHSASSYYKDAVKVHYLDHLNLRRRQMFDRPWRIAEDGTYYDERDGKPFSTQFAHTRFLTPLVAIADGYRDWALFTDCDWLWFANPADILKEADPSKTVMVVPHNYVPKSAIKMDSQPQARYNRKLWSALMLWNLKSTHLPTYEMVNMADGGYLHRFAWLDDSQIGFLSEAWHWVPGASPTTEAAKKAESNNATTPINAVHMTLGIPGMEFREPTPFDTMWQDELTNANRNV